MDPYRNRMAKVKVLLKKKGLPPLLVTNLVNIRYCTGLELSAGCLLIGNFTTLFFVDSRYEEVVRKMAAGCRVVPLQDIYLHLNKIGRISVESEHMTVARLQRLKKKLKNKKIVLSSGLIEGLRRSKDYLEMSSVSNAILITKKVLKAIPRLLVPGITEKTLSWKIEELSRAFGAESMAFETIVAFQENSALPHHHPSVRRLRKGDMVQIDMGVKVNGYCSDASRVFFTLPPTSEQRKVLSALKKAKKSCECLLKPGVSNRVIDACARKILSSYGYEKYFMHALGHGVGLEIHEGIVLSTKAPKQKLLRGEVVTLEPGVYFPGTWGMRVEDTYFVRS